MRIKTFTLMTLALLVSAVSFAQKPSLDCSALVSKELRNQKGSESLSLISIEGNSPATFKAPRRAEVVTPPADSDVSYYKLAGYHSRPKSTTERTVKVIWDGDDVYVSGLSYFLPDAFVKGTFTDDNTVVFSANQFFGTYSFSDGDAELYFAGTTSGNDMTDITATYDGDADKFSLSGFVAEFYSMDGETGLTAYWSNPTITKIDEGELELPVEIPSDLQTEVYSFSGKDYFNDGADVSWNVTVGFNGEEVYIKGLSTDLPDAWVKGTLENGVVTIPNQLLGAYGGSTNLYFIAYGEAIADAYILKYDAETGNFAEGDYAFLINSYKDKVQASVYQFTYDVNIKKITEKAATPANPVIANIGYYTYGSDLEFTVNTVDTNGDGLVTDKLSFVIYSDIDGTIAPVTLTKDLYSKFESLGIESMTEIPYNFTDNYDITSGVITLNMDIDAWTKVGIKSIYKGGDETHESETVWYTLPKISVTTLPEGANVTDNALTGTLSTGAEYSATVSVAVVGNDLYIKGINNSMPDAWVKGTKNDEGKYVFARGQYLGTYSSYLILLIGYDSNNGVTDPIISVDAENGVYKFDTEFIANAAYVDKMYTLQRVAAGTTIEITGVPSAIETVKAANTANNGAMFNLAGQRVAEGYKGLVIKNGKKYVVK